MKHLISVSIKPAAAHTTDAKRKALLRCLIDKVIPDRGEHDIIRVRIVWRGGAVSLIEGQMRVNSVGSLTQGAERLSVARAPTLPGRWTLPACRYR